MERKQKALKAIMSHVEGRARKVHVSTQTAWPKTTQSFNPFLDITQSDISE